MFSHFNPGLIFWGRTTSLTLERNVWGQGRSLPKWDSLTVLHSNGRLLALPTNVGLDRKWIVMGNTLAYHGTETIAALKSLIVQATGITILTAKNTLLKLIHQGQCYKANTAVIYCHFRLNCCSNFHNIEFTTVNYDGKLPWSIY